MKITHLKFINIGSTVQKLCPRHIYFLYDIGELLFEASKDDLEDKEVEDDNMNHTIVISKSKFIILGQGYIQWYYPFKWIPHMPVLMAILRVSIYVKMAIFGHFDIYGH